ncbi:hypothetical protein C0995_014032, partial [Termitomyces sp. Mi166
MAEGKTTSSSKSAASKPTATSTDEHVSTAKPKSHQAHAKRSSVACLEADILADAAGVPSKLTRTEHHLEDSGISVAPPQRQRDVGTTLPPCPTHARSTHACVQHAINQGGSEVQMSDEEHGDIKRAGAKSKAEMIGENEGADEDKGEDEDEGADGDEEEDRDETELGSEGDGDEGDGNKAELS